MKNLKIPGLITAVIIVASVLTALTLGALNSNQAISSSGSLSPITTVNIGVYTDSGCTQNCSAIDWTTITAGTSINKTVYIKNAGTTPVTLSMGVSNWNPAGASSVLTLTWDKGSNTTLNAGASTSAVLTLTAASSTNGITTFSFTITITGTQS
jgi:hypothetical protein